MTTRATHHSRIPEPDLNHMETRLGAALHGVAPRPDFVDSLRTRLAAQPAQEQAAASTPLLIFFSVVGVVSGIVLIIAGARAAAALLELFGVIHPDASSASKPVLPAS